MTTLHLNTPLVSSRPLGLATGKTVFLKLDALQPSGSFKLRGIGFAVQEYLRRGARRLISSSSGNAGIAVAYAGRVMSVPVVVVVPESSSERAKALIRQEGAEVMVHGASWQEANALAQSLTTGADAFLHPFDDALLWQGHSSLIDEVVATGVNPGAAGVNPGATMGKPDAVVLSVGGGGLLCGVAEGLHRHGWSDVPIIAVETRGADSFSQSVAAGSRIELPAITSIATSLGARQVCARAFEWTRQHPIHSVVVSDAAAVRACLRFLHDHRILVEPACGAALAAVYDHTPQLTAHQNILVIVCGGATATVEQLQQSNTSLRPL
jgi:L-serine/L-threonine ammonia-lyase